MNAKEWYIENTKKTGGLIQASTAAVLLEIPTAQISQCIKAGKLTCYTDPNKKNFVSYKDVMNLEKEPRMELVRQEQEKILKTLEERK